MHRILTRVGIYSLAHKVEVDVCAAVCSMYSMSPSRAEKSFIVLDLNSSSLNGVVFRNRRHPCEHGAERNGFN